MLIFINRNLWKSSQVAQNTAEQNHASRLLNLTLLGRPFVVDDAVNGIPTKRMDEKKTCTYKFDKKETERGTRCL